MHERDWAQQAADILTSVEIMTRPGKSQAPATVIHSLMVSWLSQLGIELAPDEIPPGWRATVPDVMSGF